jgi:hypothetical protein
MRRAAAWAFLAVGSLLAQATACGGTDAGALSPSDGSLDGTDGGSSPDGAPLADAGADVSSDAFEEAAPPGPCPVEMAFVAAGDFCVDRWEATIEVFDGTGWQPHSPYETLDLVSSAFRAQSSPAVVPQAYISGEQAFEACLQAGKRLCSVEEYRSACRGPADTTYPYGDSHQPGVCNEGRVVHPLLELYGADAGPEIWDSVHMNDPAINQQADTVTLSGEKSGCTNSFGTFDMVGNLHEWIDDPAGTFLGGFYVDAEINGPGCTYTTTAHQFSYHDYSTGFRCCLTP